MSPHPSFPRRASLKRVITSAAFVAVCCSTVLFPGRLQAADHPVPAISGARIIDNNFDGGINPGDTITLASGTHGSITFRNLGTITNSNYITIRNASTGSGVTIEGANDMTVKFESCTYVKIDGSNNQPTVTYGIKIRPAQTTPIHIMRFEGSSRFCTIRYVEIDGRFPGFTTTGIGLSINDHNWPRTGANEWREGFLIEHNYVHNTEASGMYVGPNYANEGGIALPPDGSADWPLRNIEIAHNTVTDIGSIGIQLKSTYSGINRIHHNIVERTGTSPNTTSKKGISLLSNSNDLTSLPVAGDPSGNTLVYNNRLNLIGDNAIATPVDGQMPDAKFNVSIYNNVIIDPGAWGIKADRKFINAKIYNNTIVRAPDGILVHADAQTSSLVKDNLLAGSGGISAPGTVTVAKNWEGAVAAANFASDLNRDYHLTASTPTTIRDFGSASGFAPTDYDGVTRPQGSAADIGAYEFINPTPAAPSGLNATSVSSSTINLNWTDNATNETGFEVDRALDSGFTSGLAVNAYTTGANPAMPVPATGLAANTTYYFRARATNAAGDSANSNTASATTQATGVTAFVTGQTLSGQFNNYTGWKGMKITVGASPISVTELGRWVVAGNTQAHTVKLVTSTGAPVPGGSVSVATSGAPAGQFKHVALAVPVALSANTVYYLVSQETNGGDFWCGFNTVLSHTSAATINNAVTSADSVTFTNNGVTDNCSGPLGFKYTIVTNIAYRAKADQTSGSTAVTSLQVNKPLGVVSGDFMLAAVTVPASSPTVSAPSGWTPVNDYADGAVRLWIFRKHAGASEPGSYTFTVSSASKMVGGIVAFSGVSSATPIQDEDGAGEIAASNSHTTPTIPTTGSGTWLVSIFGDRTGTGSTWTKPSGTDERVDVRNTGSGAASLSINTQGPVTAGNKSHTATASVSSDIAVMAIVALQP